MGQSILLGKIRMRVWRELLIGSSALHKRRRAESRLLLTLLLWLMLWRREVLWLWLRLLFHPA
jgi:hypothetical protein